MKKLTIIIVVIIMVTSLFGQSKVTELVSKSYASEAEGSYQDALTEMFAVTHLAPNNAFYLLRTAWLYYSLGNYTDARTYYIKSYAIDNNNDSLDGMLTCSYLLYDWDSTITYSKKVVAKQPKNFLALAKLAYSYYAKEDYTNSAKYYEKVNNLYSYNVESKGYYLSALMNSNQKAKAKGVFTQLKAINPDNAFVKLYEKEFK